MQQGRLEAGLHIPDGFINAGTSLAAGALSAGGVAVCMRQAARTLTERLAPLAGLVSAFVFAAQMLNFPIAAGTSGHLIGGVLAAVLVGPWAAVLCLTVVLGVQALFADGGLTALGLNVMNMALLTALPGYLIFLGLRRAAGVVVASGIAAGLSVVIASLGFVVQYALGGTGDAPLGAVLGAMAGVHTLIGIGEGVLTAMTVGAVLAVRPDLVHGAPDTRPALQIKAVRT